MFSLIINANLVQVSIMETYCFNFKNSLLFIVNFKYRENFVVTKFEILPDEVNEDLTKMLNLYQ
jgi:hypothetical protein